MRGGSDMRVFLVFVAIALAGCASRTQYIRADGQYAAEQQIESARTACASASGDHYCMVEKGYFLVPTEQAEAKRAQLAAIVEADEQRRQAELAAFEAEKKRQAALKNKKQKKTVARRDAWPSNSR